MLFIDVYVVILVWYVCCKFCVMGMLMLVFELYERICVLCMYVCLID